MSLPDELSPCENVRRTCFALMKKEKEKGNDCIVGIDSDKLLSLARQISQSIVNKNNNDGDKNAELSVTEWDEEGWHYSGSNYERNNMTKDQLDFHRRERVALYVLALDAINFCFWPSSLLSTEKKINGLEYDHLAIALKKVASADDKICEVNTLEETNGNSNNNIIDENICFEAEESYALSPRNLIRLNTDSFLQLIQPFLPSRTSNDHPSYDVPCLSERVRLLRELGYGLLQFYKGSALHMIQTANQRADTLVHILTASFPGFRDSAIHCTDGNQIFFYKRAQICVGDLWASLRSSETSIHAKASFSLTSGTIDDDDTDSEVTVTNIQTCCDFVDLKKLTTFADYRVPQLLRNVGVLTYSPELANHIDNMDVLNAGSKWELYIRAATVVAVEKLVECVKQVIKTNLGDIKNNDLNLDGITSLKLDWYLWQLGEKLHREKKLEAFHMVRTIFY